MCVYISRRRLCTYIRVCVRPAACNMLLGVCVLILIFIIFLIVVEMSDFDDRHRMVSKHGYIRSFTHI